jgi:hypothetical protein
VTLRSCYGTADSFESLLRPEDRGVLIVVVVVWELVK